MTIAIFRPWAVFLCLAFGAIPAFAATTQIQVLSAVVRDQKIPGASIILQKNGEQSATATTDDSGIAQPNPVFADNETVLLIIKKAGYSDLVVKCPCNGLSYAISPVMTSLDGMRVVLNWGIDPPDLDLHVAFPGNHIFFRNLTAAGADANLDIDHTDSYGPETITIEKRHFDGSYVFAVHDYTDKDAPSLAKLSKSGAKVLVYIGQSLVRTYYVPKNAHGNLWTVFRVTPEGEFQDINSMSGTTVDAADVLGAVNSYLDAKTQVVAQSVSAGDSASAVTLNRNGESTYHNGDIDGAAQLFRQAIEIDPNFGQAYSNLGLAYQKLGRTSEAIWADRKAIALASGPTAPGVRASSYYNIAKIYETAGQYADALRHYQLAKDQKDIPVYTAAIDRVRALIH